MATTVSNGAAISTREAGSTILSDTFLGYNFQKSMKNNCTDFTGSILRRWGVRHHLEELREAENNGWATCAATQFVHQDMTPECIFKTVDPDRPDRTCGTEVIFIDEFASFGEQFGLMGAKGKADEKKHRQDNLNELLDRGRISREKLQADTSTPPDLKAQYLAYEKDGRSDVSFVNLVVVASINIWDFMRMKTGNSGSQEMAVLHRVVPHTTPVYVVYGMPSPEFVVPDYLLDGEGKLLMDEVGWKRNLLRPLPRDRPHDFVNLCEGFAREIKTFGKQRRQHQLIPLSADAMTFFRWADSGCQTVALYVQYLHPDWAAELRNTNRALGKRIGQYTRQRGKPL